MTVSRLTGAGAAQRTQVDASVATLELPVSRVLWLWDTLSLELGEVALVTDGHPWSALAALAATWYGALPVLFVGKSVAEVTGVTCVESTWSDDDARNLSARLSEKPGIAAVDLSGIAGMVDLLLEALPPSSRLMLAGSARERLTIDYYINVHRKGLRLVSGVLAADAAGVRDVARMERAQRLLSRPAVAGACRAALRVRCP